MKKTKNDSIWELEQSAPTYPNLMKNLLVDVAVVGGGMTGILTAYCLQQYGLRVIVLEADRIGCGITHNTTAKITSQHNYIYQELIQKFGLEKAKEYAKANQNAIKEYEKVIQKNHIECDFLKEDAYLYSTNHPEKMRAELEAAKKLGLPASYTTKTALPFSVAGAVRFENQASFHPLKFLYSIAKDLEIYEHSRVTKLIGENELQVKSIATTKEEQLKTQVLCRIKAKQIVIATHYPILNFPGFYFTKMHQERVYFVAVKAPEALPYGMYISEGNTGYSFRKYKDYVLIGGCNHRTGHQTDKEHFKAMISAARKYYHRAPVEYWWSNQDCMTNDGIPYIGTYSTGKHNIYVATGYNKWGMSTSMVAAKKITGLIMGEEEKKDSIFYPRRFQFKASKKQLFSDIKVTTNQLSQQAFFKPKKTLQQIKPGYGGVILYNGKKVGVYRSPKNVLYMISTRCPHLGCMLEWNQEERTWDCPCHGSRFDYRGRLITGPAQENLKREK